MNPRGTEDTDNVRPDGPSVARGGRQTLHAVRLQGQGCLAGSMCPKEIAVIRKRVEVGRTGAPISTAESQEETHPGLSSSQVAPTILQTQIPPLVAEATGDGI
jgi:hypothetical protein